MKREFQAGDIVRVIGDGSFSGHHLIIGTIVTIVETNIYTQADFTINVQGTEDSFVRNEIGWDHELFGRHCQAVKPNQIELVYPVIPASKKHNVPHMPII